MLISGQGHTSHHLRTAVADIVDTVRRLRLKLSQHFGNWTCPRLQVDRREGEPCGIFSLGQRTMPKLSVTAVKVNRRQNALNLVRLEPRLSMLYAVSVLNRGTIKHAVMYFVISVTNAELFLHECQRKCHRNIYVSIVLNLV